MTHPYAPIPAINPGSATAEIATDDVKGEIYGHPLAPHWRRYGAMFVDMALLAAPLIAGADLEWVNRWYKPDPPLPPGPDSFLGFGGLAIVALIINVMNATSGRSPGKRIFHTAVALPMLDDKGRLWLCRAPIGSHVRRTILNAFSFLGWGVLYLLPFITKRRQTLADKWAGTVHVTWYFDPYEELAPKEMPPEAGHLWDRQGCQLVRRDRQWTEAV